MTTAEARAALKSKFPGKQFYLSCHYWSNSPVVSEAPQFAVCVYDAFGPNHNASGHGETLAGAVEVAINARPPVPQPILDAEAMFGHAAVCGEEG